MGIETKHCDCPGVVQLSLPWMIPWLSLGLRMVHRPLPLGSLDAATQFWRSRQFNTMDVDHSMAPSSSVKCIWYCFIY